MAENAVGQPAIAARRPGMAIDDDAQRHDLALRGAGDPRLAATVDDRHRQVKQKIDNAWLFLGLATPEKLAEHLADLRPDTGKTRHGAEQGVEEFRPHFVHSFSR